MKWLAILLWAGMVPVVMAYLRQSPAHMKWAAFAMGLIPFLAGMLHLYVAPIAWPGWAGWPKGIEVSILDFLAIAVIASTQKNNTRLRQLWPWFAYLAAVLVAVPHAQVKMAGFFYVWQTLRMILVAVAAMRIAAYPGAAEAFFKGIFAGVCYHAFLSITQVAGGAEQASGGFGAQNLLGIMAHFALFPAFAMLMAGRRGVWPIIGFATTALVDVLTASRATIGLAAIGMGALCVASIYKGFTSRKMTLVGIAALIVVVAAPFAISSIKARQSGNSVESSNFQRAAMEQAAWMIIQDYPLGTGPDQYVVVSNLGGYAARAGVGWDAGTRGTAVHNSYLLIWAETGLTGLIGMVLVLTLPMVVAWRTAMRFKRDPRSELLLGVAVATAVIMMHLLYEWVFVLFMFQYTFAMVTGVTLGLAASFATNGRVAAPRGPSTVIPQTEAAAL